MNLFRLFILPILLVVMLPISGETAGLWLYEQGTPNMGTASAGRVALASDASTAGTNPAAMTLLERSQLLAGLQVLYVDTRFDTEFATFGGGDGGNAGGWVPAGSFSYVHKISPDLRLGVSVSSYFGLGLDYGKSWAGRYYVQEAELVTVGVTPGVGYRINEHWSVGAGLSIVYSKLDQKTAIRNLSLGEPDGQLKLEDDDLGYGYGLGVLYEFDDRTRLGLTYRSEVELEYKDTASVSGLGSVLGGIANVVGLLGNKLDLEMNLPQSVMFSAYHKMTDQLAILGNIGWQEWSTFGETTVTLSSTTARELTQDRNFDDTWHFALGFQYEISEPWLLSMGVAYDESPVSDSDRTPDMPLDRQWRYGTGLQYDVNEDITVGCAYELLDAGDAEIDQNKGALAGAIVGDYSTNYIHFFNFNLIKRF